MTGRNRLGVIMVGLGLCLAQSASAAEGVERFRGVVRVSCAPNSEPGLECSPSVGMLVMEMEPMLVSKCTATLIGPDRVITNAHCVPRSIRQEGASCAGIMDLHFPIAGAFPREAAGCNRVEMIKGGDSDRGNRIQESADIAVLQLSRRVERPVISLSASGAQNGETLRILKMSPVHNGAAIAGIIETVKCSTVLGSAVLPYSNHSKAAYLGVSDCDTISGNSGSLYVNAQGLGVAVNQSSLSQVTKDAYARHFQVVEPKPFHIATNLACHPIADTAIAHIDVDSNICNLPAWGSGPIHNVQIARENSTFSEVAQNQINHWAAGNAQVLNQIQWEAQIERNGNFAPRPVCIKNGFQSVLLQSNQARLMLVVPQYTTTVTMDNYYRPSFQIARGEDLHVQIALTSTSSTQMRITPQGFAQWPIIESCR